jgi:hypothetical protein
VQVSHPHAEGGLGQWLAAVAGSVGELELVGLDVLAGDVGDLRDRRVWRARTLAGELPQGGLEQRHR